MVHLGERDPRCGRTMTNLPHSKRCRLIRNALSSPVWFTPLKGRRGGWGVEGGGGGLCCCSEAREK